VRTSEADLKALMIASLDGDGGAYRVLLGDLRRRLSAYFSRRLRQSSADVDDLVQDTLMAIHTRRETYDRSLVFTAWAFAIARYKLIDHYRRRGRRVFVPLEDAGALFAEDDSAAADARADIERALAKLPERTRTLVRGVKLDELSHAEAAAKSGMTEGAVKVAVHRGLKALTAHFGGGGDTDER
jgi:RNA polymerase sigma-70 factor (ECF subfamily)